MPYGAARHRRALLARAVGIAGLAALVGIGGCRVRATPLGRAPFTSPAVWLPPQGSSSLIGMSVQGRPITAVHIGDGAARIVAVGGIHTGAERNTVALVSAFAEYFLANPDAVPAGARVTLVPAVNVDGLALGTRVNAHSVDLNRNWPSRWQPDAMHNDEIVSGGESPLSEPETAALYALLMRIQPHVVLSWHSAYSPSGEAEGNAATLGATGVTGKDLARAFADGAGMDVLDEWTAYAITGQLLDTLADLGIPGVDIELPSNDGTFFDQNLAGLLRVMDTVVTALR